MSAPACSSSDLRRSRPTGMPQLLNMPRSCCRARWDTAGDRYVMYSPGNTAAAMQLGLGRGFWVLLDQATVIHPEGSTAPAGNFAIQLTAGWHQLANPFFGPIDFGSSTVTANSNTMDLASAETAGVFGAFAWTYSTNSNEYVLAYPDLGHGEQSRPGRASGSGAEQRVLSLPAPRTRTRRRRLSRRRLLPRLARRPPGRAGARAWCCAPPRAPIRRTT